MISGKGILGFLAALATAIFLLLTIFWLIGLLTAGATKGAEITALPAFNYGGVVVYETFRWLSKIIASLFPWPLIILLVLAWLGKEKSLRNAFLGLLSRLKLFKMGGAEVHLDAEAKEEFSHNLEEMNEYLHRYRGAVSKKMGELVQKHGLEHKLERIATEAIKKHFKNNDILQGFRATIHVKDFMLEDHLCQAVNYYYGGRKNSGTKGAGRFFSDGYGVVGRVWRSREDAVTGNLSISDDAQMPGDTEGKITYIAKNWGMHREKARGVLKYQSFGCLLMEYEAVPVGLLYFDCPDVENAFLGQEEGYGTMLADIRRAWDEINLPKALDEFQKEMSTFVSPIKIAKQEES